VGPLFYKVRSNDIHLKFTNMPKKNEEIFFAGIYLA
jgi:hypothetical protein